MKNPATADQLLELASLQIKRLKGVANQESVKAAIKGREHPFWTLFEKAAEALVSAAKSIVRLILTVELEATPAKKTAECFTDRKRYYYREPDLNILLPEAWEAEEKTTFNVHTLTEPATFKQMAESLLETESSVAELAERIIERKLHTALPAIEALIERQESGEDVGLRTDSYAHFFFVLNKQGGISVVRVYRSGGQWSVCVSGLDYGSRWLGGHRLLVRN